jgi:hypothetical protein
MILLGPWIDETLPEVSTTCCCIMYTHLSDMVDDLKGNAALPEDYYHDFRRQLAIWRDHHVPNLFLVKK